MALVNVNPQRAVGTLVAALAYDPEVRHAAIQAIREGGGFAYRHARYTWNELRRAWRTYRQNTGQEQERRRRTPTPRETPRMDTPSTGVQGTRTAKILNQQYYSKSKKGSRRRLSRLSRLVKLNQASQNAITCRWQALSLYNTTEGSKGLGYLRILVSAGVYRQAFPMYCWDLTTLPVNVQNSSTINFVSAIPCYRLLKAEQAQTEVLARGVPARTFVANEYYWYPIGQENGDERGSTAPNASNGQLFNWNLEYDDINGAPLIQTQRWFVDWAKAAFSFTGAKNRPVKIHVALCSFKHPGVGPVKYKGSAVTKNTVATITADDSLPSTGEQEDGTMYWDNFWATRTSHPIRSSINPQKIGAFKTESHPMKMWAHESILIGQDTSINNDTIPLQYTLNRFMRLQKLMMTAQKQTALNNTSAMPYDFGYVSNQANQTVTASEYCTVPGVQTTTDLYAEYDKSIYLLLWADVYDRVESVNNDPNVHPSFDLVLRAKYSYNN